MKQDNVPSDERAIRLYISNIKNPIKKKYALEVINLVNLEGKKIAYHAFCTDGVISASLLKGINEGDLFIPLDYSLLNNEIIGPYLSSIEWYAILDLKPFVKTILNPSRY